MTLSLVIGVIGIIFILLFLSFNLDKEHGVLKSLLIIFAFSMLFIVPAGVFDTCEVVVDSATVSGNVTSYDYTEYCYDVGGSEAFIKAVKIIYYCFIAYLIVYLFVKTSWFLGRRSAK